MKYVLCEHEQDITRQHTLKDSRRTCSGAQSADSRTLKKYDMNTMGDRKGRREVVFFMYVQVCVLKRVKSHIKKVYFTCVFLIKMAKLKTRIYIYIKTHTQMHTYTHTCTHTDAQTCTHIHKHICTYTHTWTCTYSNTRTTAVVYLPAVVQLTSS